VGGTLEGNILTRSVGGGPLQKIKTRTMPRRGTVLKKSRGRPTLWIWPVCWKKRGTTGVGGNGFGAGSMAGGAETGRWKVGAISWGKGPMAEPDSHADQGGGTRHAATDPSVGQVFAHAGRFLAVRLCLTRGDFWAPGRLGRSKKRLYSDR